MCLEFSFSRTLKAKLSEIGRYLLFRVSSLFLQFPFRNTPGYPTVVKILTTSLNKRDACTTFVKLNVRIRERVTRYTRIPRSRVKTYCWLLLFSGFFFPRTSCLFASAIRIREVRTSVERSVNDRRREARVYVKCFSGRRKFILFVR